jgi:hypothetical protein
MDFEKLLPLIIVFVIWRLSEKIREKQKRLKVLQVDTTNQKLDVSQSTETEIDTSPHPFGQISSPPLETVSGRRETHITPKENAQKPSISCKKIFLRRAIVWSEILSPPVSMRD